MAHTRRRRRAPAWLRWLVVGGLVVIFLWTGWITVRALAARDQLVGAMPVARELAAAVTQGDDDAAQPLVAELRDRTVRAYDLTHDPVWRATEFIPFVGPNLTAVRQVTEITSSLAAEGIDPLLDAASGFEPDSFGVVDGSVDLAPIIAMQPDIAAANEAMGTAREQASAIDVDATVGPVRESVEQLLVLVDEVTGTVDALDRTAHLLPAMLGEEGPRSTLVLIQNNAELRASGGVSGALALLSASQGHIELSRLASTRDFSPPFDEPVLPLDTATASLYGEITGEYLQDVNLTPWFDVSGPLAKAMWERRMGGTVDAVIAVDPVLLSYLLAATGPVQVGDVTLTSENAVDVLLSETYARFADPVDQDAFFASAAQAVFGAVTSGAAPPQGLVAALVRGGDERRIRVWSAHDADQVYVAGTTLSGALSSDDAEGPRLGVYLNDGTGAKMDYYLDARVTVASGTCRSDDRPSYRVTVTLENEAPLDAATALPGYVTGGGAYGVAPGKISTIVGVYGPVGSVNQGATISGKQASGLGALDRGRPAVVIPTELGPGESTTIVFDFLGDARARGPVEVETTPSIRTIGVQHRSLLC